jgi:hypothetical protein
MPTKVRRVSRERFSFPQAKSLAALFHHGIYVTRSERLLCVDENRPDRLIRNFAGAGRNDLRQT